MSKKRKTRREKMTTRIRAQENLLSTSSSPVYVIETPISKSYKNDKAPERKILSNYSYVKKDIARTFLVTSILLGSSVILSILIQNHIINLSMLGY